MDIRGDLITSGSVVNPTSNQVLANTGAISLGGTKYYLDFNVIVYSSAAATFEIGVFDASDNPSNTFTGSVLAGDSKYFSLENIPVPDGFKFKVRAAASVTGTVSAAINFNYHL